ncbi:MAG TPA: hypothetical protein VFF06_18340 [Polyangia bacterium]|nr:hypothetical protein [Polyangia bacterium]
MIDPSAPLASWFLWIVAIAFLFAFALPLLVVPLDWARVFRWRVPSGDNQLTEYFGRCLGAVAVAIVVCAVRAAPRPRNHPVLFELLIISGGLLTAVHAWGAIRRRQPWTETVEIALYAGLTVAGVWIYRRL